MSRTHVAIILDKSSSMAPTKDHTISGFNEQIAQIKLNAAESKFETTVTLVTFNGDVFEHLFMVPAAQLEEADPAFYKCEGMTAMYDGMGFTVKKLAEAMAPDDDTIVITISDGDENASHHYSASAIKEMLDTYQATKHWTFTYMGCGSESIAKVALETGIPVTNMASWKNNLAGSSKRAMVATAESLGKYLRTKEIDGHPPDKNFFVPASDSDGNADKYMDYTRSAGGTPVDLSDAIKESKMQFGQPGARSVRRCMCAPPNTCPVPDQVVDRPQDLELRIGTSDLFGNGKKAEWE